jgi:Uma2 family endonuclease
VATALITAYGLEIPPEALSLEGFRNWLASLGEEAPRMCFSEGRLHIEMSPQDYETHGPIVDAINDALARRARELGIGRYFRPPSWFTDERGQLSTEPDGFLVRWESIRAGLVRINPERTTELLGRPDMALEVVSTTSRKKDTVDLVRDYARAGVSEYWIADALRGDASLRILLLGPDGAYTAQTPDSAGWIASPMYQAAVRLRRTRDRAGWVEYELDVRVG